MEKEKDPIQDNNIVMINIYRNDNNNFIGSLVIDWIYLGQDDFKIVSYTKPTPRSCFIVLINQIIEYGAKGPDLSQFDFLGIVGTNLAI